MNRESALRIWDTYVGYADVEEKKIEWIQEHGTIAAAIAAVLAELTTTGIIDDATDDADEISEGIEYVLENE